MKVESKIKERMAKIFEWNWLSSELYKYILWLLRGPSKLSYSPNSTISRFYQQNLRSQRRGGSRLNQNSLKKPPWNSTSWDQPITGSALDWLKYTKTSRPIYADTLLLERRGKAVPIAPKPRRSQKITAICSIGSSQPNQRLGRIGKNVKISWRDTTN